MSTVPDPSTARVVEPPPAWLQVVVEGLRVNRPHESVIVDAMNVVAALNNAGFRVARQRSAAVHHDGVVTIMGHVSARAMGDSPVTGLWVDEERL